MIGAIIKNYFEIKNYENESIPTDGLL